MGNEIEPEQRPDITGLELNLIDTTPFPAGKVSYHVRKTPGGEWRKEWHLNKRYLNSVFTGFFFIPETSQPNGNIAIKLRGGPHHPVPDTDPTAKDGCCYIFDMRFQNSQKNNFGKECPHHKYDHFSVPTTWHPGDIRGEWIGVKCSTINIPNNGVRCIMSIDMSGNGKAWKLFYDLVDRDAIYHKKWPLTAQPFLTSPVYGDDPRQIVRIDALTEDQANAYQMKNATMSEIGNVSAVPPYPSTIAYFGKRDTAGSNS